MVFVISVSTTLNETNFQDFHGIYEVFKTEKTINFWAIELNSLKYNSVDDFF